MPHDATGPLPTTMPPLPNASADTSTEVTSRSIINQAGLPGTVTIGIGIGASLANNNDDDATGGMC